MKVTYYALKDLQVGNDLRKAGDLVPEAAEWPFLSHYISEAQIAPVLVVTLPQKAQDTLAAWEAHQRGGTEDTTVAEEKTSPAPKGGDKPVAAAKSGEKEKV